MKKVEGRVKNGDGGNYPKSYPKDSPNNYPRKRTRRVTLLSAVGARTPNSRRAGVLDFDMKHFNRKGYEGTSDDVCKSCIQHSPFCLLHCP